MKNINQPWNVNATDMDARELRIGNLVLDDRNNEIEVESIIDDDFLSGINLEMFHDGDYEILKFDACKPIPLTDELLQRFGFEPSNDTFGGHLSPPLNEFGDRIRILDNKWRSHYTDVEIKYLHQLQNLWYVLVGTELEASKK